jgi:hypothetical protein
MDFERELAALVDECRGGVRALSVESSSAAHLAAVVCVVSAEGESIRAQIVLGRGVRDVDDGTDLDDASEDVSIVWFDTLHALLIGRSALFRVWFSESVSRKLAAAFV